MTKHLSLLFLSLIFLLTNCGQYDNSKEGKAEELKSKPVASEAERFHLLGRKAQFEEKDYSKAIKLYKKAIATDSGFIDSYEKIAEVYSYNNQADSIEFYLRQALNHNPSAWISRANLGTLYSRQERYNEAIQEFKELGRYYKNDPIPYSGAAEVYLKMNQLDKALENSHKALEIYQKEEQRDNTLMASGDAALMVGLVYYKKNNKVKAKEYMVLAAQKHIDIPENFRKEFGIQ